MYKRYEIYKMYEIYEMYKMCKMYKIYKMYEMYEKYKIESIWNSTVFATELKAGYLSEIYLPVAEST